MALTITSFSDNPPRILSLILSGFIVLAFLALLAVVWWYSATPAARGIAGMVVAVLVALAYVGSRVGFAETFSVTSVLLLGPLAGGIVFMTLLDQDFYHFGRWVMGLVPEIIFLAWLSWLQWPLTWLSIGLSAGWILACIVGGAVFARIGNRRLEEEEARRFLERQRSTEAREAARAAKAAEAERIEELARRRREDERAAEAERREAALEEQRAMDEQRRREEESDRLRREARQRVDKEKAADIDAAHALDARLSRDEWLEREAQVLYRVSQASKERITLAELSQECNLTIGQTYRAVASLQDLYYVTVREMTAPTDWWQLDVAITREGHAWLRTTHGKRGLLMEKQWHFHAPVTAQSIGDNAYMPDARMKSIPVDSSAVQGFIAAARELRARVEDETTAGHLDAELHALETAQDKRDPVNRLLGMARGLGEIGLPLVAAAEKLQGMFGG